MAEAGFIFNFIEKTKKEKGNKHFMRYNIIDRKLYLSRNKQYMNIT